MNVLESLQIKMPLTTKRKPRPATASSATRRKPGTFTTKIAGAVLLAAGTLFANSSMAQLDFDFNFEESSLPLNCSGNCPDVSTKYAREGKQSMRAYLNRKTSAVSYRTEGVIPGKVKKMIHDRDYWIGFSTYLPSDWTHSGGTGIMAQIHATLDAGDIPDGPPFVLKAGRGDWVVLSRGEGRGTKTFTLNSAYEDVGKWTDWVIRYRPSYTGNGILQVWKDGTLVIRFTGTTTSNDKVGPYWKMGIYEAWKDRNCCNDLPAEKVVYHDALRIASGPQASYEDVAPRDGSQTQPTQPTTSPEPSTPVPAPTEPQQDPENNTPEGPADGSPYVEIADLVQGQNVSGTVPVHVIAQHPKGVKKVVLWGNSKKLAVLTEAPYDFAFDSTRFSSRVRLKAVAHFKGGTKKRDTVRVDVH